MVVANGDDDPASLLTVCAKGFGKRTPLTEYRSQNRGGKGLIDIKTSDRNGPVVAIAKVTDADEVMLTTTGGILIRTPVADMRLIGRNTQGVRLIRVEEGDSVSSLAKMPEAELAAAVEPTSRSTPTARRRRRPTATATSSTTASARPRPATTSTTSTPTASPTPEGRESKSWQSGFDRLKNGFRIFPDHHGRDDAGGRALGGGPERRGADGPARRAWTGMASWPPGPCWTSVRATP